MAISRRRRRPPGTQLMARLDADAEQRQRRAIHEIYDAIISTGSATFSDTELLLMSAQLWSCEKEYTTRTLDEEIDTVAICPAYDEYMVLGTYYLVKKDSPHYGQQVRRGSIRVMTVSNAFIPKYAGMLPPQFDRIDLPCAVVDIHFHPGDPSLLGAVTSNGSFYLYRFAAHGDVLGRRVVTKLLLLGSFQVAEKDQHGSEPLITQFTWFDEIRSRGTKSYDDVIIVDMAATTSFGETRVMKISVPAIRDMFDPRLNNNDDLVHSSVEVIHKHDLEAWTVATINFSTFSDKESNNGGGQRLIMSGGDDSALIASTITPATPEWPPMVSNGLNGNAMPVWKDRKTHQAGVVAILPIRPPFSTHSYCLVQTSTIPVLTGSYDDRIRVMEVDTKLFRPSFKAEFDLGGGVWRLKVLDEYSTDGGCHREVEQIDTGRHYHYLVLACVMHAGAAIVRVTYKSPPDTASSGTTEGKWMITLLKKFVDGHMSMVYSCDAKVEKWSQIEHAEENHNSGKGGEKGNDTRSGASSPATEPPTHTIVSTSFYDKKVCTWTYVDEFKVQGYREDTDWF